jgi:hypothetical protein
MLLLSMKMELVLQIFYYYIQHVPGQEFLDDSQTCACIFAILVDVCVLFAARTSFTRLEY